MQRTNYKKIDIYLKRPGGLAEYVVSTTSARTLRIARERYATASGHAASDLITIYSERPDRCLSGTR
jgi:hypothetical protein